MTDKYDLHCHSTYSDGDLSPSELLALAAQRDISHLALTDHDSLAGIQDAQLAAKGGPVALITGLELSATWRGQLLHVVGLGVDVNNATLNAGVALNQQRRRERAERMIADFLKHDIDLAEEVTRLLNDAVPTRPHFAQALINLGYAKDKNQAFKRYLVRGKPGFIPLVWPSLEEIGEWITHAGGQPVLAHPLRYGFTRTKLITLIGEMKANGIDAMEVSTPINDDGQIDMLARIAIEQDLYGSMGSDFHSNDQPWARLGSAKPMPEGVVPVWHALQ